MTPVIVVLIVSWTATIAVSFAAGALAAVAVVRPDLWEGWVAAGSAWLQQRRGGAGRGDQGLDGADASVGSASTRRIAPGARHLELVDDTVVPIRPDLSGGNRGGAA